MIFSLQALIVKLLSFTTIWWVKCPTQQLPKVKRRTSMTNLYNLYAGHWAFRIFLINSSSSVSFSHIEGSIPCLFNVFNVFHCRHPRKEDREASFFRKTQRQHGLTLRTGEIYRGVRASLDLGGGVVTLLPNINDTMLSFKARVLFKRTQIACSKDKNVHNFHV